MITTASAVALRREDGIAYIRINQGVKQSLANARENLAALRSLAGPAKAPALVNMSGALPLDPEVRHHYSDTLMDDSFTKMALVVATTPLGRMMGNVYFRIARTGVPMRLFADEASAAAWLLEDAHG